MLHNSETHFKDNPTTNEEKNRRKSVAPAEFVCLPHNVLENPPISHRHTSARCQYVSRFEFSVLSALLVAARSTLDKERHRQALAAGKRTIKREKADHERYMAELREAIRCWRRHESVPLPIRHHTFEPSTTKPTKYKLALKFAGEAGYERHLKKLRRQPAPEVIAVELSRYVVLRLAGLATNGTNLRALDQALDRLMHPVGSDGGVLIGWQQLPANQLRLQVRGHWLPNGHYQQVPMPLPMKSSTALSLYLFLHFVNPGRSFTKRGIDPKRLYKKLGIPIKHGRAAAIRAFERAFDLVNAHVDLGDKKYVADFDGKTVIFRLGEKRRIKLKKQRIKLTKVTPASAPQPVDSAQPVAPTPEPEPVAAEQADSMLAKRERRARLEQRLAAHENLQEYLYAQRQRMMMLQWTPESEPQAD
jgi:hypothetical protein